MTAAPGRGRVRLALAIVVGMGLLLWLAWSFQEGGRPAPCRLIGLTHGPRHLQPPAALSWIRLHLPDRFCRRLGWNPPGNFSAAGLGVWYEASSDALRGAVEWQLRVHLGDSLGFENHSLVSGTTVSWVGETRVRGVGLQSYPRRPRELSVRLYDPQERGQPPLAEQRLRVPNTGGVVPDRWAAEPMPARRQFRGGSSVLESVQVRPGRGGEGPQATAWLRLPMDAQGAARWRVESVRVRDATGNDVSVPALSSDTTMPGEVRTRFWWPLWSDEPAWTVAFALEPLQAAALEPDEVGWVRDLAIPPKDGVTRSGQLLELRAGRVEVLGLVGEHATLPGREHDMHGVTTLEVGVSRPTSAGSLLLLELRDDQGREVKTMPADARDETFMLVIPAGAKSLSFAVALCDRPVVEYRVRPEFEP